MICFRSFLMLMMHVLKLTLAVHTFKLNAWMSSDAPVLSSVGPLSAREAELWVVSLREYLPLDPALAWTSHVLGVYVLDRELHLRHLWLSDADA